MRNLIIILLTNLVSTGRIDKENNTVKKVKTQGRTTTRSPLSPTNNRPFNEQNFDLNGRETSNSDEDVFFENKPKRNTRNVKNKKKRIKKSEYILRGCDIETRDEENKMKKSSESTNISQAKESTDFHKNGAVDSDENLVPSTTLNTAKEANLSISDAKMDNLLVSSGTDSLPKTVDNNEEEKKTGEVSAEKVSTKEEKPKTTGYVYRTISLEDLSADLSPQDTWGRGIKKFLEKYIDISLTYEPLVIENKRNNLKMSDKDLDDFIIEALSDIHNEYFPSYPIKRAEGEEYSLFLDKIKNFVRQTFLKKDVEALLKLCKIAELQRIISLFKKLWTSSTYSYEEALKWLKKTPKPPHLRLTMKDKLLYSSFTLKDSPETPDIKPYWVRLVLNLDRKNDPEDHQHIVLVATYLEILKKGKEPRRYRKEENPSTSKNDLKELEYQFKEIFDCNLEETHKEIVAEFCKGIKDFILTRLMEKDDQKSVEIFFGVKGLLDHVGKLLSKTELQLFLNAINKVYQKTVTTEDLKDIIRVFYIVYITSDLSIIDTSFSCKSNIDEINTFFRHIIETPDEI